MIERIFARMLGAVDRATESAARSCAHAIGRRSFLSALGGALVGSAFVPVLPFDRSGAARAAGAAAAEVADTACDYWRYCALDGFLCSCCGGSISSCPPGSEPSKVTWIGTCHNPKDGKDYLISYNDCCGKTTCGQCLCNGNQRERPGYRMGVHNDINWCMANTQSMYHCTVAAMVGVSDKG